MKNLLFYFCLFMCTSAVASLPAAEATSGGGNHPTTIYIPVVPQNARLIDVKIHEGNTVIFTVEKISAPSVRKDLRISLNDLWVHYVSLTAETEDQQGFVNAPGLTFIPVLSKHTQTFDFQLREIEIQRVNDFAIISLRGNIPGTESAVTIAIQSNWMFRPIISNEFEVLRPRE